MGYISKQNILTAYKVLSTNTSTPTNQGATQYISAIRYLFALDRFCNKFGRSCDTKIKQDKETFVEFVGEVVKINKEYYTSNFHLDVKNDSDYKVGSNFFSVNVVKDSLVNPSLLLDFPRRSKDGELFKVQNGLLTTNKSFFKNLNKYLKSKECKIALAIWLCRDVSFNEDVSPSSILSYLTKIYSPELVQVLNISHNYDNYCMSFGKIDESEEKAIIILEDINKLFSADKNNRASFLDSNCSYNKQLCALRTKPFLLLAGISGTGKSRIVKEMAYASCPDEDDLRKDDVAPGNYLLVEVKPNWHDSTELLGYESTIKESYVLTPFVKFLYKAMKYPNIPFFVCLDEMNLAPVEQYFAEFLSILESRKLLEDGKTILSEPLIKAEIFNKYPKLALELNGNTKQEKTLNKSGYTLTSPIEEYIPMEDEYKDLQINGLRIPQNVLVIGTVNMDETTHQFSRKVIDRAMTIEMNEVKFDTFFDSNDELGYTNTPLGKEYFLPKYTSAKKALDSIPEDAEFIKKEVPKLLEQLNKALDGTPFKIAYRVQNELVLYFVSLREETDNKTLTSEELLSKAMNGILMMKVLPRIEGDKDLLEEPLKRLEDFAKYYTDANAKIEEMQTRLKESHYTSFWP